LKALLWTINVEIIRYAGDVIRTSFFHAGLTPDRSSIRRLYPLKDLLPYHPHKDVREDNSVGSEIRSKEAFLSDDAK
jgi:hypothetical protein